MEVSGKKDKTPQGARPQTLSKHVHCHPCSADGEDTVADGFCQNCQEYLCATCIKHHHRATLSKHHTILNKSEMPKNIEAKGTKQPCTEVCKTHVLEVIKFYCKDHDFIGCGTCMVLEHKTCSVDFIPDIADDFVSGTEIGTILKRIKQVQTDVEAAKEAINQHGKAAAEAYTHATQDIRKFRREIQAYLDEMEKSLTAEFNQIKKENETALYEIQADIQFYGTELDNLNDRLTAHSKQAGDLFILAKQTSGDLKKLEQDMKEKRCYKTKVPDFVRNTEMKNMVAKKLPLGNLVVNQLDASFFRSQECCTEISEFNPVYERGICIKSSSDSQQMLISNMCILSDDLHVLLCLNRHNNTVNAVDPEQGSIISQIMLQSEPWDMTAISDLEVAVTLPGSYEIAFLLFKDRKLTVRRKIKVGGKCRGIAYTNNTLIVTFKNKMQNVQILSSTGEVLRLFRVGDINDNTPSWPGCIDVGIHGNCIYVSDYYRDCVYKMTLDGAFVAIYRDSHLKSPRALSVCNDGSVLVCSNLGNSVHLITADCEKVKVLLSGNEAKNVLVVCYDQVNAALYLYKEDDKTIRVYRNS